MPTIQRILFPTDFSEPAGHAWSYALTFAREFDAELHALHVVTPPPRLSEAYAGYVNPETLVEGLQAQATAALEGLVQDAKNRGLVCQSALRLGVDFTQIIDYALAARVDLIVMATHGRTGLAHALMGSVAEKVVRKAPCPVLTVKHPAAKFETP
jgi:nucleotide-binding universal stress UspA family protein